MEQIIYVVVFVHSKVVKMDECIHGTQYRTFGSRSSASVSWEVSVGKASNSDDSAPANASLTQVIRWKIA